MLLDRFKKYVVINTQSDENSNSCPSTRIQYDLLNVLKDELDKLNVNNELDEYGRIYAQIDGNNSYPAIGLCAHVDTARECSDENVQPQVIKNYDLSDIKLGNSDFVLSPKEFKKLLSCKNKTIICTDGTTLLGADDKAGIAIIMEALENVLKIDINKRRPMRILFTPDEEIGRGPDYFSASKFDAKYAFTIDGSDIDEIAIENFNAKSAFIEIIGKSIHPGDAKDIMVNSILVMNEFISLLPPDMIPSKTEKYEGFNHIVAINGEVERTTAQYIIRNHDMKKIEKQVDDFQNAKKIIEEKYPSARVNLVVKDQYKNMIEVINKNPECKQHIENVYKKLNIPLKYNPIRGGTDGATFSFKGVPCPNLGTGSYNHHGRFEFAVLEEMQKMVEIVTELFVI